MKNKYLILITALVLTLSIVCAGCVTDSPVKTEKTEIPSEMSNAFSDLEDDLHTLEGSVTNDMTEMSKYIGTADEKEIYGILGKYYAMHPRFTAVIYHDTVHEKYYSVPVFLNSELSSYKPKFTEEDFKDAEWFIVRNSVFTQYRGYQNMYYKAVFDENDDYQGYLVFVIDPYPMIYLNSRIIGNINSYDGYICFIADSRNKILFSTIEELIGEEISSAGLYDGLTYLPRVEEGDGAVKYTSRGNYLYDDDAETEKITAWHTIHSSRGEKYTIYLVDRLNLPELKTENVVELDTSQALSDVRGAYLYCSENGISKLKERIKSGYYKTPIYLINHNGDVIEASETRKVGHNYLNNRGLYGVSFIQSAILKAEHGGGYIYYLEPAERVINPRGAEYTLGIVMPVNDNYFLYCKTPGSPDLVLKNNNLRNDLLHVTNKMLIEASLNGIDAVAEKVNTNGKDLAKLFAPEISSEIFDIAILDTGGNIYASVQYPELVGKSATFMTDAYGGSITRMTDMLAKTGGGFMSYLSENKDKEGYVDLWVASVEPRDNKYYVYASTLIATFEDVLTPALENVKPTK